MLKGLNIILFLAVLVLFSCRSAETKTTPEKTGIDTLYYEDPVTAVADTTSLIDSLVAASAKMPIAVDDSADLALKARLAADTLSTIISDSVKHEIRKARDYMRDKQNR